MTYTYRGNHRGPDLFDAATRSDDALPSPYDQRVRGERDASIAFWYARGCHDKEIAETVGVSADVVKAWRDRRGLLSNFELLVKF